MGCSQITKQPIYRILRLSGHTCCTQVSLLVFWFSGQLNECNALVLNCCFTLFFLWLPVQYSVTSLKTIPELCRRCDSQNEDRSGKFAPHLFLSCLLECGGLLLESLPPSNWLLLLSIFFFFYDFSTHHPPPTNRCEVILQRPTGRGGPDEDPVVYK